MKIKYFNIEQVFVKFKTSMSDTIKMFKQNLKNPDGICMASEFQSALKYCDISFSSKGNEYLELICY